VRDMPRRIISEQYQATAPEARATVDGYFDRVIKYIPSDIVGAWVAVKGIIPARQGAGTPAGQGAGTILWIAFVFGTVITALWVWRQTKAPGHPTAVTQVGVATVAFVVWVFALGRPFATLPWYEPYLGSLALIAYTLVVGLIVPKE
jgi:hypothetical protein